MGVHAGPEATGAPRPEDPHPNPLPRGEGKDGGLDTGSVITTGVVRGASTGRPSPMGRGRKSGTTLPLQADETAAPVGVRRPWFLA